MNKILKRILIVLLILIIIGIVAFVMYNYLYDKKDDTEVKVIKSIDNYGYTLKENETKLYKENFDELVNILNEKDVSKEDYAKCISKLFIIDFYTLSNKKSKNDVGGSEFVYPEIKDNFIEKARSTIYKYIESDVEKRTQSLPTVSEIKDVTIEDTTFTIYDKTTTTTTKRYKTTTSKKGTTVDAYKVNITWDYSEDLGYEKEANIIIIEKENKLYIVEMD